ncbi:MAG: DUF2441 domain-containing protein [Bacilli bacterium]|nr:DUF2441 domain-containing protein [Bacilli bacterium]
MFVEDKEMYHIHTSNKYDNLWFPGNIITIDNNFKSYFREIDNKTMTGILNVSDELVPIDNVIREYLKRDDITLEQYKDLLEQASIIIHNMSLKERECVLEWVRQNNFSHLPSRNSCIWLTDEKDLEFWKNQLGRQQEIFKVSATGVLFKSADRLLPSLKTTQPEMFEQAVMYWEAKDLKENDNIEYLFQGKLKLLERVK